MGRVIPLKVNPKSLGPKKGQECVEELAAFFQCMQTHGADVNAHCAKEKKALSDCASAAAAVQKKRSTVNYHLQRLARNLKKR